MIPIVIPLHHAGGKLRDNTELRFALRSLCENLGDFRLVIVGKHVPEWLGGAEHLVSEKGLKKALRDTSRKFPEGFIWWYDDLVLLKPSAVKDLMVTPCSPGTLRGAKTGWAEGLERISKRLAAEGYAPRDYSRPHGPYFFDSPMVEEGFADWPGMSGKFPWESWILSKRDWPRRHTGWKQYYGKFSSPPGDAQYLNYNDKGNTPELRSWLLERFPVPCRYESRLPEYFFIHVPKTGGKSILATVPDRVKVESLDRHKEWSESVTQAAWRSAGSPPILAAVRNPIDRAISIYHYFRNRRDFREEDAAHVVLSEMCRHMGLSEFWEKADIKRLASVVKHLRPQHAFLHRAPGLVVMRFESLSEDYASVFGASSPPLLHLNASPRSAETLTPAAIAKIRKHYAADFKHYYPRA